MANSRMRLGAWGLIVSLSVAAAVACGSSDSSSFPDGNDMDGSASGDGSSTPPCFACAGDGGGLTDGGGSTSPLVISPASPAPLVVRTGSAVPTVSFTATENGVKVAPVWSVDRGEIGAINVSSGVFTPTGTLGGTAKVTATLGARTGTVTVTVNLSTTQNGAGAGDQLGDAGAGGVGGVGGEGVGGAVSGGTQTTLSGAATADSAGWLYPYDATVWPRGLLPPLLQWAPGTGATGSAAGSYDAVYIDLKEAHYEYQGFFAATATPFIHHPIPQSAWTALANSNQGEPVVVSLTFSAGGVAYGPIKETWTIASGELQGTVYYQSYGTQLVQNFGGAMLPDGGTGSFGAATLGIRTGDTSPSLVAGRTGGSDQCRVCHNVSANGGTLITGQYDNGIESAYDLKNDAGETVMPHTTNGQWGWGALEPNGSYMLTNAAPIAPGTKGSDTTDNSALYWVPDGGPIASATLPAIKAGMPAFSPDGKHVAFNYTGGTLGGALPAADGKSLAVIDFDPKTYGFSNPQIPFTPTVANAIVGWPSFFPTNDAIIFEVEDGTTGSEAYTTRSVNDGPNVKRATLWWTKSAGGGAAALNRLNGYGPDGVTQTLPTGPNNHAVDANLAYEPTVNPIVSGGYAWVVFTSRRLYGNIATTDPGWSDPRYQEIQDKPTTKKLWVAAIDLNAPAGTDPSHPAFYLPAQELYAGNSRGFWVVDPCRADGATCATGNECCGGYCRAGVAGGALVCTNAQPTCSQQFEKCTTDSNCCGNQSGALTCINGFCSQPSPGVK